MRGDRRDPLWRMYPERWLESLVFSNVAAVDARLDPTHVYSQVPAFSASDRAMIDVLTCTRDGRLAVLELKADEDIHLPLQGLDYWARVVWHHARGEFQQHGYFPAACSSRRGRLFCSLWPLRCACIPSRLTLCCVTFSPAIEWGLVGVDERWREGVSVIYRKTSAKAVAHEVADNELRREMQGYEFPPLQVIRRVRFFAPVPVLPARLRVLRDSLSPRRARFVATATLRSPGAKYFAHFVAPVIPALQHRQFLCESLC